VKKILILSVFVLYVCTSYAQNRPTGLTKIDENGGFGGNDFSNLRDTTKVKGGLKGGKLLDDSTKQIYGPTTSKYTYFKDLKYTTHRYLTIDTLIDNVHRFNFVNNWDNKLQDLGNIGTPSIPMYYQLPEKIGVTSGYTIFDPYQKRISQVKYFDTHSPFSDIHFHNGGRGRGITDIVYSRNINERWNVGFDFRGLFIDKQLERKGKGDRHVTNTSYDFFTHYKSKDDKYQGVFTFVRNMHRALEIGGIRVVNDSLRSDFFEDNAQFNLYDAVSSELTRDFLIYQEYNFSDKIGVYYDLERNLRKNEFIDKLSTEEIEVFYDTVRIDSKNTLDRQYFDAKKNEIGVKGNVSDLFYNFYYKNRRYKVNYAYLDDYIGDVENYGGGNLRYDFDSTFQVGASGEYMTEGEGAYQLNAYINHPWVNASYSDMNYRPSVKQRFFYGNHAFWTNDFNNTSVKDIKANVNLKWKSFLFKPKVQLTQLNNYIYYDTAGLPRQSKNITALYYGSDIHFVFFKRIHIKNEILFSEISGESADVLRVPDILMNAQLYYENILFKGNLQLQAGVDGTWKSAYFANAYNPAIQEFHLQNDFGYSSFGLLDIFVNIKINRGIAYFKYINVGQLISSFGNGPIQGYFASPRYAGQRNGIDFGVKWAFYD